MSVSYLPAAEGRDDPIADQTARELVFLAGPDDALLIPDDAAFDLAAVELAACGIRQVRLTLAERLAAATRILATGASIRSVCLRLGLPADTERRWEQLRKGLASVVSALVILTAIVTGALFAVHANPGNHRVHHPRATLSREHRRDKDNDDRKRA